MISFTERGSFKNTERYLNRLKAVQVAAILEKFGEQGIVALSSATPVESGLTAQSWRYTIIQRRGYYSIRWHNTNTIKGTPVAILIQYGHGTGTGGYVQGRDFINPAIRPIFDAIAKDIEKEVTRIQ